MYGGICFSESDLMSPRLWNSLPNNTTCVIEGCVCDTLVCAQPHLYVEEAPLYRWEWKRREEGGVLQHRSVYPLRLSIV